MPEIRIGCSGFSYRDWRGTFYPDTLAQKHWFEHYCAVFSTVELNVTFYRLPQQSTFEHWKSVSPPEFVFSLKGSRLITHLKRLIDPAEPLDLFFRNALLLEEKLRVILWQFPPSFKINLARLKKFLELLDGYPALNTLEFRNATWIDQRVFDLCSEYNVSICMADWPAFVDDPPVTADFVYIRRHGETGGYDRKYSKEELLRDAQRVLNYLKNNKEVYMYFNNDYAGYAPENAQELIRLINL